MWGVGAPKFHRLLGVMILDIIFISLALIMVYLGWRSGFTGQLLRVVAAACVFVLTAPVSGVIRELWLERQEVVASPGVEVGSMILAAVLIYIGVSMAGSLMIHLMRKTSDTLSGLDRLGGVLLGGVKALLIVYILAVCVNFLHGPLESLDPEDRMHLRDGESTHFVEQYDVLAPWRFPHVKELQAAVRVAELAGRSEPARVKLRSHASAADFIRKEDFKALMKQSRLVDAARRQRYALVLADASARGFLNEQENADALSKVDWERVEKDLGVEVLPPDVDLEDVVDEVKSSYSKTQKEKE